MCARKENEPLAIYLLRYALEEPRVVLGTLGFVAACYMYIDLMAFVRENTAVQRANVAQLQEINVRLGHLEREHEMSREHSTP